jgi:hypothetical protein
VRQKGYHLYYVPSASVIHLHNQSARQEITTAQKTGQESETRYFQKHYGGWSGATVVRTAAHWRVREDDVRQPGDWVELGACIDPPVFSLSVRMTGEYVWQLSPFPSCVPAIARLLSSPEELALPAHVWAQIGNGEFFARLFSLPDLRLVRQWRWRKTSSLV